MPSGNIYVVKSGDSLFKIANNYGTTVSALKTLNNLTSDSLYVGQVLQVPINTVSDETIYTVKSGDSLWKIANNYGITVNELKDANNLTSNSLSIGQVLKIPTLSFVGVTYTVKSGDSLWKVANNYGITVNELKEANNLTNNSLSIGQVLKIPTPSSIGITYTVKNGDSLWKIANLYNTTVDNIKSLNNLASNNLSIGQILKIT